MTINQAIEAAAGRHHMYYCGGWQRADGQGRWPTAYWAGRAMVRDARIAYVLEHAAGISPARAADVWRAYRTDRRPEARAAILASLRA